MRVTTDTFTGKPFRWNGTCIHKADDGTETVVPHRIGARSHTYLHPTRVPPALLAKLNPKHTTEDRT